MPSWKKVITSGSNAAFSSLIVSNTITGSISGSLTGSLFGTASWATHSLTASYAENAGTTIDTSSFATTGSNIFVGNQIISGSGVNFILQVHGANAESWAFGIYNDTYSSSQPGLAGWVDNTGEANIGTEDDKPLYIYTNAAYNTPTLIISSSGVTIANTLTVNNGITGSLHGTASWAENVLTASYVNPLTQNVTITGSLLVTQSYISTLDYIDFNHNIPAGTPAFGTGRLHWVDDTKTLGLDTDVSLSTIELGHQQVVRVVNLTNNTITKGSVVYITGSQGTRPGIATASYTAENDSATTLGLVMHNILGSGGPTTGYVVVKGLIRDVNTFGFQAGQSLYLSSSGQYSTSKPQAPLHDVRIGKVIVGGSTNAGVIYVDIQNGYELDELHNVRIVSDTSGDLLVKSSSLWINSKQLTGSYGLTGSLSFTGGGVTGSLFGTSSWAQSASNAINAQTASFLPVGTYQITASWAQSASQALTASRATTASFALSATVFPFTGSAIISGSLTVTGSTNLSGTTGTTLFSSNADTLTITGSLIVTGSSIITGSLRVSGSITGSLFGTASWATNALTASFLPVGTYQITASWAQSASQALTASFIQTAQTASYILNAVSASFATTASYIDGGFY